MTPVDMTKVFPVEEEELELIPRDLSTAATMSFASFKPPSPVTAFAHPLLITMARIPSPLVSSMICFDTSTGAALNAFVVNTADAVAGVSDTIAAKSKAEVSFLTPE